VGLAAAYIAHFSASLMRWRQRMRKALNKAGGSDT
jgi:hypothetical protein